MTKDTPDEAVVNLLKILEEKILIGSMTEIGFIIGRRAAVCLQESPLDAIAENLLYEKKCEKKQRVRFNIVPFDYDSIRHGYIK